VISRLIAEPLKSANLVLRLAEKRVVDRLALMQV